jgi:hypothetical protein
MSRVSTLLSSRDRAILSAVAAGRCEISGDAGMPLVIDELACGDQFAAARLTRSGLILVGHNPAPPCSRHPGRALLETA